MSPVGYFVHLHHRKHLFTEIHAAKVYSISFGIKKGNSLQEIQTWLSVLCCTVIHSDQYSASLNTSSANGFLKIYIFT